MKYCCECSKELPKYKCHKEVHALKILVVFDHPDGTGTLAPSSDSGFQGIPVDKVYMEKHHPYAPGYYVVYEDGYKSWSPVDAFERGYTLIKNAHPSGDSGGKESVNREKPPVRETWLIEGKTGDVWGRLVDWFVHGSREDAVNALKQRGWPLDSSLRACRYVPTDDIAAPPSDSGGEDHSSGHA